MTTLRAAEREKVHGGQRVDDLPARYEQENRRLREELSELRDELNLAREEARVQRSRAGRAEGRLNNTTVATKARRRWSYAGRTRRREGPPWQKWRRRATDTGGIAAALASACGK